MVAAWLVGVLIGLETSTPLAPLLLLLGGSICMGLALYLRRLPVFPALLAVVLLLAVWRADSVATPPPVLPTQDAAEVVLEGRIVGDPEFAGGRVEDQVVALVVG